MIGAISLVSVSRHSCSVANAAAPSGVPGPSQNRRRDRRTYQLDRSSMNVAIRRPGRGRVERLQRGRDVAHQRVQLAEQPPVEHRPRRGGRRLRQPPGVPGLALSGRPAFAYRTRNDTVFQ